MLNGMHIHFLPFMLGLGGTAQALTTTGEGVILHLVPRPGGAAEGQKPITLHTAHPVFPIHHASGSDGPVQADGSQQLTLYSTAWPDVRPGPFLGDWGGAVPLFDDGRIKPTQLMRTVINLGPRGEAETSCEIVMGGACIDHPQVDPRFDGDRRCRYIYSTWCNGNFDGEAWSTSGSPPIGWCRYDSASGEAQRWLAPSGCFCEEPLIIPKEGCAEHVDPGAVDEADTWLAGMMFDSARGVSCLAILDGANLSAGPVCKLWLRQHVPHGLHGCWVEGAPCSGE
jgi:all-trans-8'-apo-beta-carotenal 15,15'-oxygenase